MRDRMIELLDSIIVNFRFTAWENTDKIADHLLANGVIVPPCKIGTRVYRLIPDLSVIWPDPTEYKIIWDTFKLDDIYTFGKTVFLTKEEAEKALMERKD